MIEFGICFGAFVLVLLFMRNAMHSGAFVALGGMLSTTLALLVTLRYWFLVARLASQYDKASPALLSLVVFWVLFLLTGFVLKKFRENYSDSFESVLPSIIDRGLSAVFGLVTGAAFVFPLLMTLTIAAPEYWTSFKPAALPLPLDRWTVEAYRSVENRLARIGDHESGHTLLPALQSTGGTKPAEFWK